ncbi:putative acetyltransferase [Bacteroides graminisolvens DSM 19988 = JCM 15093]|uniref:Putative acetyltransferase n=1 Tax=Bacteroides graminisolvens DSM 19988 = JCM 15093 TaxID=1121097 RepID=A0A069D698_9BACE|nr:putative acetyltransferase [Bacteroides graminisolvens DSM 19988 = JCM 15093]
MFFKKSVMFFKKLVMFFKKSVMFYQSLAGLCYSPVCSLIIYKLAIDKICLIQDIKG